MNNDKIYSLLAIKAARSKWTTERNFYVLTFTYQIPSKKSAEKLASIVSEMGYEAEVYLCADTSQWQMCVRFTSMLKDMNGLHSLVKSYQTFGHNQEANLVDFAMDVRDDIADESIAYTSMMIDVENAAAVILSRDCG